MKGVALDEAQLREAVDAVNRCGGNIAAAARALGMDRQTLAKRVERAKLNGIKPPERPEEAREFDPEAALTSKRDRDRARIAEHERDVLLKKLELAQRRAEVLAALGQHVEPIRIAPPSSKGRRAAVAVLMVSDDHVEEEVDPITINGRNRYNLQIAEQRFKRLGQGLLWQLEHHAGSYDIRQLLLWLGGDIITGYIHEELVEANNLSPTKALLFAKRQVVGLIESVLAHTKLEKVLVPCNYGNHGRTTAKPRIQTGADNSFEWLLYHMLADHFAKEPRVQFSIADGSHLYTSVWDWRVRTTHGDDLKFHGGVGGLVVPLRKAIGQWNRFKHADLTLMGHFHQFTDLSDAVVNGSLIGYNAFALRIRADYEPPQQGFFLIDRERGKREVSPIWVDDIDRRAAA